jgi:aspartyl-tRNA(Asn)/glutamyl-tRNA(Gln) amidotransferase subunit B
MENTYKGYRPTIGIEVHAELKTKTKMFCRSKNEPHASESNVHVCPVCMGHPGTLPVVNEEAVKHVLRVGIAVNGELADYTEFDRKNYFYPDIPKGYQISQYEFPLVKGGILAGVALTRVHLEEDTARSQHDQSDGSLIDYNRAGVPLMELVTEPVIHDAKTAANFAQELQLLLRTLCVSDAHMEKGEMRVEANISVSKTDTFGTKVEVKNLNSFKSVESAIQYEVKRQVELLERGERVVQETRGWDESKNKTFSQRLKETADDYRYFPDPDIPKFRMSLNNELSLSRISESLPELPESKRQKYSDIGIPREQIEYIISNMAIDAFFKSYHRLCNSDDLIRIGANYLTSDVAALLNDKNKIENASHDAYLGLMKLVNAGSITSRVAKDLLSEVIFEHRDADQIARERGLLQVNDATAIDAVVEQVMHEHVHVVLEYRNGKDASLQFLVGQGMKISRGTANPALLVEKLKQRIRNQ